MTTKVQFQSFNHDYPFNPGEIAGIDDVAALRLASQGIVTILGHVTPSPLPARVDETAEDVIHRLGSEHFFKTPLQ